MPDGDERRARDVQPLGVHRHAALLHAARVPHEPRRHRAGGGVRQQLVLAELHLLRAPAPGQRDEVHRDHLRTPRHRARGRAGALRRGARAPRGRGRDRAHRRPRPAGAPGHPRPARGGRLAALPAPLSDRRGALPRLVPARGGRAVGHLRGGPRRHADEALRGARLRDARADPTSRDAAAAGDPGPREAGRAGRHRLPDRRLCRRGPARRAAGHRQEAARLLVPLRLPAHGRPHQHRHRRPVGCAPHPRHRAGRGGRVRRVQGAGQHAARGAAAGRGRAGNPDHAQLVHGDAGRAGDLHGLPRDAEQRAIAAGDRRAAAHPAADRSVARPRAAIQLPARGAAGARPGLRRLPRRCRHGRSVRTRPARPAGAAGRARAPQAIRIVRLRPGLPRAAPIRPSARPGERLPPAQALRVPREHERADPDAARRPPRGRAGRRGLGPPGHVDRPQRAGPRHLGRAPPGARRLRHAAPADGHQVRGRGPGP